jgi:hypothetical protein
MEYYWEEFSTKEDFDCCAKARTGTVDGEKK